MAVLELNNVTKSYGNGKDKVEVLSNINLSIEENEFVAIVGYTGSGKTTLINLLTGLLSPDEGEVICDGKPILGPDKERGIIFQNYSLLPWLTVTENILLAVKEVYPNKDKTFYREHVMKYVNMVGLEPAKNKYPSELSGGMRQRTSVARALAMEPKVMLMDEPLSALDALTRGSLQKEFAEICAREKKTFLLITNDVDEAILLADRIIPLQPGPNACLGTSFKVDIPRPREISKLNKTTEFLKLRNDVTNYLLSLGKEREGASENDKYKLPKVKPMRGLDSFQRLKYRFYKKKSF